MRGSCVINGSYKSVYVGVKRRHFSTIKIIPIRQRKQLTDMYVTATAMLAVVRQFKRRVSIRAEQAKYILRTRTQPTGEKEQELQRKRNTFPTSHTTRAVNLSKECSLGYKFYDEFYYSLIEQLFVSSFLV